MPQMTADSLLRAMRAPPLTPQVRHWVAHYSGGLPGFGSLYVSTDDLKTVDAEADAKIHAVDLAVAQCAKLSDADRANWTAFMDKWRDLHQKNLDIIGSTLGLGAGDALSATQATKPDVLAMQDRVSAVCRSVIGPATTAGGLPWTTVLLIAGAILLVGGGLWLLAPVIAAAARPRAPSPV